MRDAWALQPGDIQLLQQDPEGAVGRWGPGGGSEDGNGGAVGEATCPISYVRGDTSRNGSCCHIRPVLMVVVLGHVSVCPLVPIIPFCSCQGTPDGH